VRGDVRVGSASVPGCACPCASLGSFAWFVGERKSVCMAVCLSSGCLCVLTCTCPHVHGLSVRWCLSCALRPSCAVPLRSLLLCDKALALVGAVVVPLTLAFACLSAGVRARPSACMCGGVSESVCPSVCLYVCRLSLYPSVRRSVCLPACLSVLPSVCPSVRLPACLSGWLPVCRRWSLFLICMVQTSARAFVYLNSNSVVYLPCVVLRSLPNGEACVPRGSADHADLTAGR